MDIVTLYLIVLMVCAIVRALPSLIKVVEWIIDLKK